MPRAFAKIALILLLLSVSCRAPISVPVIDRVRSAGTTTITDMRIPSSSVGGALRYRAIVPVTQPGERLPVLYLLHGANSGPDDIERHSEVVQLAATSHFIVIIPDAKLSYYTNARNRRYAHWEDAIVFDLPRDVEARFPVLLGREHRGIAGISMGGYGAVKLALKHPELYGFSASMSGALDITRRRASLRRFWQSWRIWTIFGVRPEVRLNEDVFTLLDHSPDPQNTHWFFSCSKGDPLFAVNNRFLRQLGQRAKPVSIITPGAHDWQSWNFALPAAFNSAALTLH